MVSINHLTRQISRKRGKKFNITKYSRINRLFLGYRYKIDIKYKLN